MGIDLRGNVANQEADMHIIDDIESEYSFKTKSEEEGAAGDDQSRDYDEFSDFEVKTDSFTGDESEGEDLLLVDELESNDGGYHNPAD